jgi:hypothetical protein
MARRDETTITEVINRALFREIQQDTATHEDASIAPVIEQLLKDRHGRLETGLRNFIARVAHEVLRNQYILCTFLNTAGVKPDQLRGWRTDGYKWAVKELRQRPEAGESAELDQ